MGRILVQNRRPVVPGIAINTIMDAAIVAWNGFPEADTQSMVLGGWVRERTRSASYPTGFAKGAHNTRGVEAVNIQPNRAMYAKVDKSGSNSSDSLYTPIITLQWANIVVIYTKGGLVTIYVNGAFRRNTQLSAGWTNGEWWTEAGTSSLVFTSNANIATCSGIFASTNDPNKVLITPEQIRAMYETGAIPKDIIYWPMDEGAGSGAGTCKAYVNGVNVPALDGSLSANSWVADSPFN